MTSKELLYVEDALEHELFLCKSSKNNSTKIKNLSLSTYIKELEETHSQLLETFLNLL